MQAMQIHPRVLSWSARTALLFSYLCGRFKRRYYYAEVAKRLGHSNQ